MSMGALVQLQGLQPKDEVRIDSLADWLVMQLAHLGITTYFGVPGGAIEPLLNALARQQRAGLVELIPTRSEAGAAFAADGYFRAKGRMAACITTTGPGVTNLATATLAAYADRIPMLLLTPRVPLARQGRGAFQDCSADPFGLFRLLENCTRFSAAVTHPTQLSYLLGQALHFAQNPPGGPVHLSIATDLLAGPLEAMVGTVRVQSVTPGIAIDEVAVANLVSALTVANFPVLYVGDDAGPDAARLCEIAPTLGGVVVSSPAGKRWVTHLDRSYLGVVGFAGHGRALEAVQRSDLVVTFGATFDEFSTNAWTVFDPSKVFAVDRHANFMYRQPGVKCVISDTRTIVDRIASEGLPHRILARNFVSAPPPSLVRSGCDALVHPLDLMRWISNMAGSNVVVHVDTGSSMAWSTRGLTRPNPDTYRVSMGACSMCWAIGAAIGAAVAKRQRVVCITGDGAMLMSSLELTVAVEHNLPVTCVVLNDSNLGMVSHGQRLSGAEMIATRIAPVSFATIAHACGVEAMTVQSRTGLDSVPTGWLRDHDGGPRLIDVKIDPDAVPPIGERVLAMKKGLAST
jgi:acetolactate synthase I/II/III large subunit